MGYIYDLRFSTPKVGIHVAQQLRLGAGSKHWRFGVKKTGANHMVVPIVVLVLNIKYYINSEFCYIDDLFFLHPEQNILKIVKIV